MRTIEAAENGPEGDPMAQPARRYIVRAVPVGEGYAGEFAFPGGTVDRVREGGRAIIYEVEEDAIAAAGETLVDTLNNRFRTKAKPERIRKMTGPEFAVALADLNISPTQWAAIYGTSQDRVMKWIDGEDDVPHPVRLLLAVLAAHPGLLSLLRQVTAMVSTERRPRDDKGESNG